MSLMNALSSGISGLSAYETKMDVIGNNIANVETVGFKSSRVTFAAMLSEMAGSGGGIGSPNSSAQIGLGVKISSISRNFSQGGLHPTGRETDVAIQGDGFFLVEEEGQKYLTRAGNFSFNKKGYFVTQDGSRVQGFNANSNGEILASGVAEDIIIDFNNISEPKATQTVFVAGNLDAKTSKTQIIQAQLAFTTDSGSIASTSTGINDLAQTATDLVAGDTIKFNVALNDGTAKTITYTYSNGDTLGDLIADFNSQMDAFDPASDANEATASLVDGMIIVRSNSIGDSQLNITNVTSTGTGEINFPSFQVTQDGDTNSQNISSTIYDSLGNAHTLVIELTQTGTNKWSYEASFLDGEQITAGNTGTITFNESGKLTGNDILNIAFNPGNGAEPMNFSVKLGNPESGSRLTQYSGSNSAQVTSQDGYSQGELVDFNIDGGGSINGIYSNGQTITLAQIAIADVANYHGLDSTGDGLFRTTNTSGKISVNTASELANTSLLSSALESSNVKLAEQFTSMITAQRAFQANARVITTTDKLLQEVVNLKR